MIRTARAEPAQRAGHQARVEVRETCVVKPHRGQHARPVVLDQHVAPLDQPRQRGAALVAAQVEGQRLLVAVERGEIPGEPVADDALAAQRVALPRGFDLDHLGAHVGEHHRAERPGQDTRQVDDPDSR